jgi:hypothetical protein
LIGQTQLNGSSQFVDDATNRNLSSYFNRRPKTVLLTPGYSDGNSQTTYTTTSTSWTAANGGTGATGSYISNGEDAVDITAHAFLHNSGANWTNAGIGDNSATDATVAMAEFGTVGSSASCRLVSTPAAGYRTVVMLVAVSGGTGTFYADFGRYGAAADVRSTYLTAVVMG